ncbi:MAG: hypothetical protein ACK47B_21620 [Armatimonadota bacterium]
MEISSVSIWVLVAIVAINTLFIGAIAVALFLVNAKVNEALDKAEPLLAKATETMGRVEDTTIKIQQKVDVVLDKTSHLVDHVSERVDTTTAIAEEAVTEPLIGAASLMAGINRGLRVYAERAGEKGDTGNGRHEH